MIIRKPPTQDHKYDEFMKKFGESLLRLRQNPDFQFLEKVELDHMEDLKTKASMLNVSTPEYERVLVQLMGMVRGIREWRECKNVYLENYRKQLNIGGKNE